jgi:hypothetical protein
MPGRLCKCGCREPIPSSKRYVNKAHQLVHLKSGEAKRLNELQPVDAKRRGGATAGRRALDSGRLTQAGARGAERSRHIAQTLRSRLTG